MDSLTGLLEGPQAREAFLLRMVMAPPWAVRVQDRAPLTVAAVMAGTVWITAGDESVPLHEGQVAILRGPEPYVFGDQPETEPDIIVHPGQHCEDLLGRPMEQPLMSGVRTWGNDPAGSTVVILGTYEHIGALGVSLLATLPAVAILDGADISPPVVDLIAAEIPRDAPGQGVVLDRLLDLLTVSALRAWFDAAGVDAPPWWHAAADPVVGDAVRLLQHNPSHRWTVASLAAQLACLVPRWPGASTTCSASPRWRSSPSGGWRWPLTCWWNQRSRCRTSPLRLATAQGSHSVLRSSGSTG